MTKTKRGGSVRVRYKQLTPEPPKPPKPSRPLSKHERVTYALPCDHSKRVVALIDRVHKDGTVTITACYTIDEQGERVSPCWLGYKYRIAPDLLRRAA